MATTTGNQIALSPTETNYTLAGSQVLNILGNSLNNKIYGNSADNIIQGRNKSR